jgi:hypothetical protein
MSDQIIFTKEEVEKIKSVISSTLDGLCIDCNGCIDEGKRKCLERSRLVSALTLLDSLRSNPKLPLGMLSGLAFGNKWSEDEIKFHVFNYGFDVED